MEKPTDNPPEASLRFSVPLVAREPILAVGGELKSALCLLVGQEAFLGVDHGHLSDPAALRAFLAEAKRWLVGDNPAGVAPGTIACDLHPAYAATRFARAAALPTVAVQHHHAHSVACMVENRLSGDVLGIACDGTGYGEDGSIWGCEILAVDEAGFRRAGHLKSFPLDGGDAAARETWRPAAGLLHETFGADWPAEAEALFAKVDPRALRLVRGRLASPNAKIVRTSSLGRLFDAVAFLLGLCDRNDTEAQAPIALQAAAESTKTAEPLPAETHEDERGVLELDFRPLVRALVRTTPTGRSKAMLARGFHEAVAKMACSAARRVAERTGRDRVVLSGGCFVNRLLLDGLATSLLENGLAVYTHKRASAGDASLALGQAVAAAGRIEENANVTN